MMNENSTTKNEPVSKKFYFASDFHLGVDAKYSSLERERQIVRWLEQIRHDAAAIYLVGDVFDYWYEYGQVVPKGYARLFGKLAELTDAGVPIYFFIGNHDMWMFRYFEEELGIPIYRAPIVATLHGKQFYIGHGDGLGPGDYGYKVLKKVFANRICQWFFSKIHPDLALWVMKFWSGRSRHSNPAEDQFLGADKEWLLIYSNEQLDKMEIDFFVFGHRHLPMDCTLKNGKSRYINLGEWMNYNSYAVFDGESMQIRFFENETGEYHQT